MPAGGVVSRSGTSFAAAVVSGIAGLLLSLQKKRGENPNPFRVRDALLQTAKGCDGEISAACDRLLAGRVNVSGAIQFLTSGVPTMSHQDSGHRHDHAADKDQIPPQGPSANILSATVPGTVSAMPDENAHAAPSSAFPSVTSVAESPSPRAVFPAGCGCGCGNGARQKVYAIGELDVDFVSPARLDSLEEQNTGVIFQSDSIHSRDVFLRYLLGWKKDSPIAGPLGPRAPNGSLHIAESVYWVLKQGQCPMYAIQPAGPFAAATYQQLIIFLIEQTYASYEQFQEGGIGEDCLDHCFYPCHGGQQQHYREFLKQAGLQPPRDTGDEPAERHKPSKSHKAEKEDTERGTEAHFSKEQLVESALSTFADETMPHVVIAGEITGKVQLYSGETVDVVCPALRGMQNWNTRKIVEAVLDIIRARIQSPVLESEVRVLLLALLARLYELVRNNGQDPCDRAKNYFATAQLFNFAQTLASPLFLKLLGALKSGGVIDRDQLVNISVDNLTCKPAQCAAIRRRAIRGRAIVLQLRQSIHGHCSPVANGGCQRRRAFLT